MIVARSVRLKRNRHTLYRTERGPEDRARTELRAGATWERMSSRLARYLNRRRGPFLSSAALGRANRSILTTNGPLVVTTAFRYLVVAFWGRIIGGWTGLQSRIRGAVVGRRIFGTLPQGPTLRVPAQLHPSKVPYQTPLTRTLNSRGTVPVLPRRQPALLQIRCVFAAIPKFKERHFGHLVQVMPLKANA